jgi:hypothetical protein
VLKIRGRVRIFILFRFSTRVAAMTGQGAAYRKLNVRGQDEALSLQ